MPFALSAWARIFVLYLAGLVAAGQFAKLSLGFETITEAYPDAGAALGFTVSLVSFLGMALGLFAGMLVGRLGYARVLGWAMLLGAGLSLFQATLPSLPLFLVSRLLEGASHLAIVIAAPTLITQFANDQQRPAAMALWSTFFAAGFALYAAFGPYALEWFGPPALLWVHAVSTLFVCAVLPLIIPRLEPAEYEPLSLRLVISRHVEVYTSLRMGAAPLGWAFYTLTFASVLTLLPQLAGESTWLPTALPLVGIVLSLTLVVVLLQVMSAGIVTSVGFAAAAFFVLAIAFSPDSAVLWLALFGALALVQAGSFAVIPEANAELRDRALSLGGMTQMGNLGNLLGTPLLLLILTQSGLNGALTFLAAAYLLGFAIHLIAVRKRQDIS